MCFLPGGICSLTGRFLKSVEYLRRPVAAYPQSLTQSPPVVAAPATWVCVVLRVPAPADVAPLVFSALQVYGHISMLPALAMTFGWWGVGRGVFVCVCVCVCVCVPQVLEVTSVGA